MGSSDESGDYVTGLVVASSITAVLFALAMLTVAILFCCGRRNVGFLSGAPFEVFQEMKDGNNDDPSLNSANGFNTPPKEQRAPSTRREKMSACSQGGKTQLWVRSTFIVSGVIFILFSILMVTQGLMNLQQSVDEVNYSAVDVDQFAMDADTILQEGVRNVQSGAIKIRDSLSSELTRDAFCPANPDLEGYAEAAQLRAKADEAVQQLTLLDNFLGDQVESLSQAIDSVGKGAQEVERKTDEINLTTWQAMLFLIPCTIVPALLVAATIMAMFDVHFPIFNRVINWFLLPLFIIMVVVSALVSTAWIAIGSANSDFCLPGTLPSDKYDPNSPDGAVYRMLDRSGYSDPSNLVRQVAQYYVEQCENAPKVVRAHAYRWCWLRVFTAVHASAHTRLTVIVPSMVDRPKRKPHSRRSLTKTW
jgi:hypothetical protein